MKCASIFFMMILTVSFYEDIVILVHYTLLIMFISYQFNRHLTIIF